MKIGDRIKVRGKKRSGYRTVVLFDNALGIWWYDEFYPVSQLKFSSPDEWYEIKEKS